MEVEEEVEVEGARLDTTAREPGRCCEGLGCGETQHTEENGHCAMQIASETGVLLAPDFVRWGLFLTCFPDSVHLSIRCEELLVWVFAQRGRLIWEGPSQREGSRGGGSR